MCPNIRIVGGVTAEIDKFFLKTVKNFKCLPANKSKFAISMTL